MTLPPISGVNTSAGIALAEGATPHKTDSPEKLKDAATQFEALMIGQLLKAAHDESGDESLGGDSDPASASAMDFANDYFARAMASKGGLGLSNMIVSGLAPKETTAK